MKSPKGWHIRRHPSTVDFPWNKRVLATQTLECQAEAHRGHIVHYGDRATAAAAQSMGDIRRLHREACKQT